MYLINLGWSSSVRGLVEAKIHRKSSFDNGASCLLSHQPSWGYSSLSSICEVRIHFPTNLYSRIVLSLLLGLFVWSSLPLSLFLLPVLLSKHGLVLITWKVNRNTTHCTGVRGANDKSLSNAPNLMLATCFVFVLLPFLLHSVSKNSKVWESVKFQNHGFQWSNPSGSDSHFFSVNRRRRKRRRGWWRFVKRSAASYVGL